jgi:DUF1680 family protein
MPWRGRAASYSVNGGTVKPAIDKGYAVITRTWSKGDRIDLEIPMPVQRVKASEKIEADLGKVALRYGPLVYNIEQVDQDISKKLSPTAHLTPEWVPGLLGGVVVIKGQFTDGSPMMAIPNFARMNRSVEQSGITAQGERAAPEEPESIVWIAEG